MKNNLQQELAINTIDGPVLIIAGPGTGKTYTLVERVMHMVSDLGIDPSEILLSTFTNKAAFELLDRLSLKFSEKNINKDVNDMLLGNFHSIAINILNEYIEYTPLKNGYVQIDEIEQAYLIECYINKFREIQGYGTVINQKREVKDIVKIVNKLAEEGILERKSDNPVQNTIFQIAKVYEEILEIYNMIDFSHILLYTYKLLKENENVKLALNKKINYIMIDEYQDTNIVQEKIIDLLLNENNNICVVGDDDQSLYRFRGATVKNILHFNKKFKDTKVVKLMHNYRSDDSIIKFYSNFLNDLINKNPELKPYRHNKLLFSDRVTDTNKVVKIYENSEEEWIEKTTNFILELKKNEAINNFNEVAILFSSINNERAKRLISNIKKNGIDVYSPKTNTLISQIEILKLIGALYYLFKKVIDKEVNYRDRDTQVFLDRCLDNFYKSKLRYDELDDFIERMSAYVTGDKFQLSLHDIVYRLFAYRPFYDYMNEEERAKKLSRFIELLNTFSLINQIYFINQDNIIEFINRFFYSFIRFIKDQNVKEFEEDTKIPEENSISAMTIHSSKGMEYPVVIMASLWDKIYDRYESKLDNILDNILADFSDNVDFEPIEYANLLDFYRKYYTGFSRAKNLLVLSGLESSFQPINDIFLDIINELDTPNIKELNIERGPVKENKTRKSYSYTVDIVPFNECPIAYFYERELKFSYPKTKGLYYGSLVHESIEFINKQLIKKNYFDKREIAKLVTLNARQKFLHGAYMLTKEDVDKAINEVEKYYDFINQFGQPLESELNIIYSTDEYVLNGNVDMIVKRDDKYHIIDFKTGNAPDEFGNHPSMVKYFYQINLYAYLFKKTKNIDISSMSLYFTNLHAKQSLYTFEFDKAKNEELMQKIDDTVKEIENRNFTFTDSCNNPNSLLRFFLNKKFEDK
ncbi:hypothetical protein HMPREF9709_00272 [Helcococcus kunzii ATCC 51366]|uniref:DNA 3'-5' helicase n=1 Tax=Helcococcus kunzii ATCC 51366 TaxID=883114 RepID=H3NLR1_9FIRM|nr:ATP-dependent DNA helicase [Helcococcus kunzii]EHR35718.1 hypothetical protein HMPREF9709_00272 [Helcococcus kunzii ATCC 51366]